MKICAGGMIKSLAAIIRPEYVNDVMRGLGCAAMVTAIRSANDTVGTHEAVLHETTAIIITLLYI